MRRRDRVVGVEIGVDVINDGEFGKTTRGPIDYGAWSSYAWGRLSGWQPGEPGRLPALAGRRDRAIFDEFYRELDATSFISSSSMGGRPPVSSARSVISAIRRWPPTLRTSRPR